MNKSVAYFTNLMLIILVTGVGWGASKIEAAPIKDSEEHHATALEYDRQHLWAPVCFMKKDGNQYRNPLEVKL